jgi:hypothetical protein
MPISDSRCQSCWLLPPLVPQYKFVRYQAGYQVDTKIMCIVPFWKKYWICTFPFVFWSAPAGPGSVLCLFVCFYLFIFVGTGVWTHVFMLARHARNCLSHTSSPVCLFKTISLFCDLRRLSCTCSLQFLELRDFCGRLNLGHWMHLIKPFQATLLTFSIHCYRIVPLEVLVHLYKTCTFLCWFGYNIYASQYLLVSRARLRCSPQSGSFKVVALKKKQEAAFHLFLCWGLNLQLYSN